MFDKLSSGRHGDDIVGSDSLTVSIDTDGDGSVSFEEFTVWYLASEERINAEVEAAFNHFDTNKNGSIGTTELKALITELHHEMQEEELQDAISRLDNNQDGEITFPQFFDWYTTTIFYEEDKKKALLLPSTRRTFLQSDQLWLLSEIYPRLDSDSRPPRRAYLGGTPSP